MIHNQFNIPLKLKQSVFFSSILVLIITNSGNVISLIFQVLLSRNLNLNDFSLFYSLVAFINIIVSPFTSFNLYIQKIAILEVDSLKKISVINITFIYFFIGVSAIFFFIFLIFINSIKNKFGHFDNYTYINFFLIFFFTLLNITPTSILISLSKYKLPSMIFFISDLLKLILVLIFIYLIGNLSFQNVININLFFVICLFALSIIFVLKKVSISIKPNFYFLKNKKDIKDLIYYFFFSICNPLILHIDIIIVRFLFNEQSAYYIVASTVSKILYFFPSVLFPIFFNEMLKENNNKNKLFLLIFLIAIIISLGTILFLIKELFINYIYGKDYLNSIGYMFLTIPAFILLAFSNILSNILISKKRFNFLGLFYGSILLFIVLCALYNLSIIQICYNLLISASILFVGMFFLSYRNMFIKPNI